jgi:AhpD family alkylhydroperoxidase
LDLSCLRASDYREDHLTAARDRSMNPRLDYYSASPKAMKAMIAMEAMTSNLSIEQGLLHLIKIRASQLNGCAFCTDMHSVDARRLGESDRRLYSIVVWRDSNFFNPRERAALAWTEAVTLLSESHVPDDVYAQTREQFNESEMVDLTIAVTTINSWNRLAVSFRQTPSA